jgi:hypothetical protein
MSIVRCPDHLGSHDERQTHAGGRGTQPRRQYQADRQRLHHGDRSFAATYGCDNAVYIALRYVSERCGAQEVKRTPLKRKTPLRAKITEPSELRKAKKIVKERSGGRCEARIPSVCTGRATDAHHVKMRSRGGKHDPGNLLDVCRHCHDWIDANPRSATQMGLLKHSWDES